MLDSFILDTMSSGRKLVDKIEIGVDRTKLTFNDEMIKMD